MEKIALSRRTFLAGACCAAASPAFTPLSFAAAPGDKRMVTIVLRGALDGLYLVQPYADPLLARYRPDLSLDPSKGLLDLDGRFGLHPLAKDLMPLWKSGELGFVHAVSTPYRDTRSHFDGQDILESGGDAPSDEETGWLNRAIGGIRNVDMRRAIDVSSSSELILTGPNPVDVWSTRSDLDMGTDEASFFKRLYASDPAFSKAFAEATGADTQSDAIFAAGARADNAASVAKLTAGMLKDKYRIANFSIGGWDSHINQNNVFKNPLKSLVAAITTLKRELGSDVWSKTSVLAMTEFGRTVRQNGSNGTDHGTGGVAILAGGAIRGGKIYGKWPGLTEDALFENRDLMPTTDVREIAASLLNAQFDISAGDLTTKVFPGLDLASARPAYLKG
ncbi:uncharacterized protein (DUF1501 family) [Rhizobium sp. SG_E_25_P2]|jgi:uncharacterized protein (DUF1501 family)|uniref:DUF1501 domain-containing protein n=1 Tax=Rhizobium sp. SG_E_25_P2 TaxID=2879942 RepID=UPI00247346DD|nr:DUF1501 domain-containing protein [Rhizobium sp. SG_E_25_P2]MDH6267212.1 uncharacterized protein (DUF1501 family) [Rhizobium sp. SG_E_25_P2]